MVYLAPRISTLAWSRGCIWQAKQRMRQFSSVGYSRLSPLSLIGVAFTESFRALRDPHLGGDSVAALGEVTGEAALCQMYNKMQEDPVGRRILSERPNLGFEASVVADLKKLPANSLGGAYVRNMYMHGLDIGERPPIRYIDDPNYSFVMRRYRHVHDLLHVVCGVPISVSGEVALKWFEMVQTGLPMTVLAAFFGVLRSELSLSGHLGNDVEATQLLYIEWCCKAARRSKFFMNIYFEEHWETNLNDFRKEIGIPHMPNRLPSLDALFDSSRIAGMQNHYQAAILSLGNSLTDDERKLPFKNYLQALAELDGHNFPSTD